MGMTIDEAAYIIEHHKVNDITNAYDLGQAFTVAINTMRKYQKIEQIAKKAILPQYAMELVDEIRKVVEDE